jgi:hypothetical protein
MCVGIRPGTAAAQNGSAALVGWVRDTAGSPIVGADVDIQSTRLRGRTDSTGLFHVGSLDAGRTRITIRRLGYEPASFEFTLHASGVDSLAVTMQESAHRLDAVRTDATTERRNSDLDGFYKRRSHGSGVFITREDIERHHTNVLSETLREVPGLRIVGSAGRAGIRFPSSNSQRHDCPPQYWLDGRRMSGAEIDDFPATDVEAMELYAGPSTTPMQFSQGSIITCGTVVIWTKIPGAPPAL